MSEPNTSDALEAQIQEATDARDDVLASELYRRQQGTTDAFEPESVAVPAVIPASVPAVVESGTDLVEAEPSSGEIVVATDAHDETVTVSPGIDFAGDPEQVDMAFDLMAWWDLDEAGDNWRDESDALRVKWGADAGRNLMFYQSFALAFPDIARLAEGYGFIGHPFLVETGAILGRHYATKSGDPSQITTRKGKTMTTDNLTNTAAIEARIETLETEIDKAMALHDDQKANTLFQQQQALYRRLPGGDEPIVGSSGRTV